MIATRSWTHAAAVAAERLLAVAATRPRPQPDAPELERSGLTWRRLRVVVEAPAGDPTVEASARLLGLPVTREVDPGVPADVVLGSDGPVTTIATPSRSIDCPAFEDAVVNLAARVCDAFAQRTEAPLVHASAFLAPGGAAVFVGPERAGKTTLAHHAWRRGLRVMGDDVVVLHDDAVAEAFPKALSLRLAEGEAAPELPAGSWGLGRADGERRLMLSRTLPGFVPFGEQHPVVMLALLRRLGHGPSRVSRLEPGAALDTLIRAGTIVHPRGLRLVRLLRTLHQRGALLELHVGPHDTDAALDRTLEALAEAAGAGW